jgi:hypothetical protein
MNDNLCYTVVLYYHPQTGTSAVPGRVHTDRIYDGSAIYLAEMTEWDIT